jgi:hypothetical protein
MDYQAPETNSRSLNRIFRISASISTIGATVPGMLRLTREGFSPPHATPLQRQWQGALGLSRCACSLMVIPWYHEHDAGRDAHHHSFPRHVAATIKRLATENDRSIKSEVVRAVREYIARQRRKRDV